MIPVPSSMHTAGPARTKVRFLYLFFYACFPGRDGVLQPSITPYCLLLLFGAVRSQSFSASAVR